MNLQQNYQIFRPVLVMVVGVPASGKTSLALEMARRLFQGCYLSKDLIQTPFTDTERVNGEIYSFIQGPTYHILLQFAETQLSLGKIPIIDAPFSINHWRKDAYSDWLTPFQKLAQEKEARLAVIRCVPPSIEILKERIVQRHYQWDAWKLQNWREFNEREPVDFPIQHDDVLDIKTDQPANLLAKEVILEYLSGESI